MSHTILESLIEFTPYTDMSSVLIDGVLQLPGWQTALAQVDALPSSPFDPLRPQPGQVLPRTDWYPARRVIGIRRGTVYTTLLGSDGYPITHPLDSFRTGDGS